MRLHLLAEAQEDAGSIAQWYESKRDGLGQEFLDVLDSALDEIAGAPLRFAKLESVETDREIRRKILPRFPYLVVFEIREDDDRSRGLPRVR